MIEYEFKDGWDVFKFIEDNIYLGFFSMRNPVHGKSVYINLPYFSQDGPDSSGYYTYKIFGNTESTRGTVFQYSYPEKTKFRIEYTGQPNYDTVGISVMIAVKHKFI